MRRLIQSTALLGIGSAATVLAAILRAKVLAALLGPQGTGLLAQLSTLTAVLVPLATLRPRNRRAGLDPAPPRPRRPVPAGAGPPAPPPPPLVGGPGIPPPGAP